MNSKLVYAVIWYEDDIQELGMIFDTKEKAISHIIMCIMEDTVTENDCANMEDIIDLTKKIKQLYEKEYIDNYVDICSTYIYYS